MELEIHHLTLTVTDVERAASWYQALLGPAQCVHREGPDWRRIRMAWPGGLVIGVTQFNDMSGLRFDPRIVGLDHVGLRAQTPEEVAAWVARMDELGIEHGPLEAVSYGWAVTARDPDWIPVEFFCPRP